MTDSIRHLPVAPRLSVNKYAGTCACGRRVEVGAGFVSKVDGRWQAFCHPCSGSTTPAPTPEPKVTATPAPTFDLTEEQQHAVELFSQGHSMAITAGAGTGKTSLLIAMALSTHRTGTYVAYNAAIVKDAAARMPSTIACATSHSLAFRAVGKRYSHRLNGARLRSSDIARRLGVEPIYLDLGKGERKVLQPGYLASLVMAGIGRFCNSADTEPMARHIPYIDGIDPLTGTGKRTYLHNDEVSQALLPALRTAWADIQDVNGSLRFSHDHYLAIWALGNPIIPGDFILVDEAQDLNPRLASVIERQTVQVIYVGDAQQQLYEFRGAVDALDSVPAECHTSLTHSWRFGAGIAHVANTILDTIPSAKIRITGRGPASTIGAHAEPTAVLTRTNAGAIEAVLAALSAGRKPHLVGGGSEVERFALAAEDLMAGKRTEHPELAIFETWGQVQDYVDNDELGIEIRLLVKLIDKYGVDMVLAAVANTTPEASADVVVSTVHKSKGREWEIVQLGADFPMPMDDAEPNDAESRLIYVAATRAKRHLDYTRCAPIMALFGQTPTEPPNAPERLSGPTHTETVTERYTSAEAPQNAPSLAPSTNRIPTPRALSVKSYVGRCQKGCRYSFKRDGSLVMEQRNGVIQFAAFLDPQGQPIDLPRCPEHDKRPFMQELTTRVAKPGARCDSRCWQAVGPDCACPCNGRFHGQGYPSSADELAALKASEPVATITDIAEHRHDDAPPLTDADYSHEEESNE